MNKRGAIGKRFYKFTFGVVFLTCAVASQGQVSTHGINSYTAVGVTNTGFSQFSLSTFDSQYSDSGAPVNSIGQGTFGGMNYLGEPDSMSFSGQGFASGQYGILKTAASGSVTNPIFNPENPWYYNSDTYETNPEGTPDALISFGQAQYKDVFTYNYIGAAVTVNFFYQITGNFVGESVYHSIYVQNDDDSDSIILDTTQGNNFNFTWVTKNFEIGADSQLNHSATVLSQFDLRTYSVGGGGLIAGQANFGSTVTLSGMVLKDAQGQIVSGWTLDSASGTAYPVPEPASFALIALAAGFIHKRKSIQKT